MCTILVVDDEEGFCHLMEVLFKRAGYKTLIANNGADGLRIASAEHPDLVILDEMMPGMTGSEVCVQIKSNPELATIPVIMHTAHVKLFDRAHIEAIGADAVLHKPSLPREIMATVEQMLAVARV